MSHQAEIGSEIGLSLEEVARLTGGRLNGDGRRRVRGVAGLDEAEAEDLALLADRRYLRRLPDTGAGALLVSTGLSSEVETTLPHVVVDDPHAALLPLLARLHPRAPRHPSVHPTAVVERGVRLGADVEIGPYAVVGREAHLGDRVSLGAHVVVGEGSEIGDDSVLHPHVVLYPGVVLGRRVVVHAGARLGSDGFGYVFRDGAYEKVPQVGGCRIEDDVEIGANTTIDRGSIGDTVLGRGSKLDNLVHIAHNVRVGPVCAMAAQVGIAGSSRIGPGTVLGGQAGVGGHLEVGARAKISAQAGVLRDVTEGQAVTGFPARDLKQQMKAWAWTLRLPELVGRLKEVERRIGVSPTSAGGDVEGS